MLRDRSVHWKEWATKHEYEEFKEGAWLEPGRALLRTKVKESWTEKASQCGQEDLGRRLDAKEKIRCWLVGYQSMSSLPDGGRHIEAQALPLPRVGMKSDGRFQRPSGSWSKNQEPQRRSGSGKEVFCASSQ